MEGCKEIKAGAMDGCLMLAEECGIKSAFGMRMVHMWMCVCVWVCVEGGGGGCQCCKS